MRRCNRDELDGLLKQAFAEGVRWPIERPSLNALSELGLSVEQIARYFSVDPMDVGVERRVRQLPPDGFGDAKIDHLHHRHAILHGAQHIGRFQIAVDDPFLMSVLYCFADGDEELQSRSSRKLVPIAKLGNRQAAEQIHDEIRASGGCFAPIQDMGNVGVIHQRQRLALGFEAGDDLLAVHARLENFHSHPAAHRLPLFGVKDNAEGAFANLLEQFV